MNSIIYLLQVSACMGAFFALYYFILKRLTFFTINRWYLLLTLAFSFVIPLLTITVRHEYVPAMQGVIHIDQLQQLPAPIGEVNLHTKLTQPGINWINVLQVAYLVIAVALFVRLMVIMMAFLAKIKIRQGTSIGRVHIIRGNKKLVNGSFLNYIFLHSENIDPGNEQQIIQHEMLHIKLLHSVDRIVLEIAKIILWFNPFIYLYARAVEENHEFEVDHEIGQLADKNRYANLLLHLSVERQRMLYNSFSKAPLEKRITMLFNKPTKKMKRIIYLLVLPIGVVSCLAFANFKTEIISIDTSKPASHFPNATDSSKGKAVLGAKTNHVFKNLSYDLSTQVSATPFYSRTHILEQDGKSFDKINFKLANGSASANLGTGQTFGLFIDGGFYSEDDIKKLPVEKTALLIIDGSTDSFKREKIPEDISAVPFCFKTFKSKDKQ